MMKRKTKSHVDKTGTAAVLQASKWKRQRTTEDVDQDPSQRVFLLVELTLTEAEEVPLLKSNVKPRTSFIPGQSHTKQTFYKISCYLNE